LHRNQWPFHRSDDAPSAASAQDLNLPCTECLQPDTDMPTIIDRIGRARAAATRLPGPDTAVWLRPAATLTGFGAARFEGPVAGAWGGSCTGRGRVDAAAEGFHAELALGAGDAINASMSGGGHRHAWLRLDDPGQAPGAPRTLELRLLLAGALRCERARRRGWGADPGASAFVGSEDTAGRPLTLVLPLDALQPGVMSTRVGHRVELRNGCWTPLVLRFATRIHTSLDQPLRWVVAARWKVVAAGAATVTYRRGFDAGPAPAARGSAASAVTRWST
jgi:hypothetical protein